MTEKIDQSETEIIKSAPFVIVPVDLIRSGASKNAILCFVSMGSFGPESRARVSSIGARMRVKEKAIVRAAQVELVDLGFIRLKKREADHEPRHWWLWPFKNWEDNEESGGGKKRLPEKASPKQTNSDETDKSSLKHRGALGIFIKEWGKTALYIGQKYIPTGKDHSNLKKLLGASVEPEIFEGKLLKFLASRDPFDMGQRHSLSLFCSTFNKWEYLPSGVEGSSFRVKI